MVLAAGACSSDGGKKSTSATTAKGGTAQFCQALAQFGQKMSSQAPALSGTGLQQFVTEFSSAVQQLAAAAPPQMQSTMNTLTGVAQDFSTYMNQLPQAAQNPQLAQQLAAQGRQLATKLNGASQELSSYVQKNCPGVTLPTVAAPSGGG
jgi:hypothetical protein